MLPEVLERHRSQVVIYRPDPGVWFLLFTILCVTAVVTSVIGALGYLGPSWNRAFTGTNSDAICLGLFLWPLTFSWWVWIGRKRFVITRSERDGWMDAFASSSVEGIAHCE
jgi:hypothetical protein